MYSTYMHIRIYTFNKVEKHFVHFVYFVYPPLSLCVTLIQEQSKGIYPAL
jgi:hypothetical protein